MLWFEKMGVLYKYFLDSVQKVLLLMHKLTNLVDIVYQRMVNVCFICGNELEKRGSAIPSFHINAFILKATLKAEWTEKDTNSLAIYRKMLTCYLITCFVFDVS